MTSNFSDSKLSFKLGFPALFSDAGNSEKWRHTGFVQPYVKATNGITTIWKANSLPVELGVSGGYSYVLRHSFWVRTGNPTEHTSEAKWWLNITGSVERGNYNLFNTAAGFGDIITKQTETNGSIYASINKYFFSKLRKYRWKSCIWGVGLGYAKTNNYTSLKSRTFQEGKIVYNADSSLSQAVLETTAGRNGSLIISEGLSGFGELYIPIIRNPKHGGIYLGNRITYFSIGNKNDIANFNSGLYFNLKDQKVVGDKPAKDILNFSITGQFNQINKSSKENYLDNNFSVLVQAAIPIRFN